MNCRYSDERLLMLIHGQLPPAARLSALAHIAVCPICRQRRQELERATTRLARAVRGSTKPAWRPHARPIPARELMAGTIALIALLSMYMSFRRSFFRDDATNLSIASDSHSDNIRANHACKPVAK